MENLEPDYQALQLAGPEEEKDMLDENNLLTDDLDEHMADIDSEPPEYQTKET